MTDFVMERQMGNVKNLISLQPRVMGETFQSQSDMPVSYIKKYIVYMY